jgi:acyl carrier protein
MTNRTGEVAGLVASVLDIPASAISADSSMENVPQWDSLAQLNVCLAFQERFGVSMDMEMIASSTSVAKLVSLLPN